MSFFFLNIDYINLKNELNQLKSKLIFIIIINKYNKDVRFKIELYKTINTFKKLFLFFYTILIKGVQK